MGNVGIVKRIGKDSLGSSGIISIAGRSGKNGITSRFETRLL
jgi:hypothetical protein